MNIESGSAHINILGRKEDAVMILPPSNNAMKKNADGQWKAEIINDSRKKRSSLPSDFTLDISSLSAHFTGGQIGDRIIGVLEYNSLPEMFKPIVDGFIELIKIIIIPLVFCTLVEGIAGASDYDKKTAKNTISVSSFSEICSLIAPCLLYFVPLSALAIIIGGLSGTSMRLWIFPLKFGGQKTPVGDNLAQLWPLHGSIESIGGNPFNFMISTIENTPLLLVLLFSLLVGFALLPMLRSEDKVKKKIADDIVNLTKNVSSVMLEVILLITKELYLVPIVLFCGISYTVEKSGVDVLNTFWILIAWAYLTCMLFCGSVFWWTAKRYGKFEFWRFLWYLRAPLILALAASSSKIAFGELIRKLKGAGCSDRIIGLALPMGFSFNLVASSVYLTFAAFVIANGALDILPLILFSWFMSPSMAAIPSSSLVTLGAVFVMLDPALLPSIAVLMSIDRIIDPMRSAVNLLGNGVAVMTITKTEGELEEYLASVALE